jgi:hypothetical protein
MSLSSSCCCGRSRGYFTDWAFANLLLLRKIVRVGRDSYEYALLEPHVKEFDITGRAIKGWVLVEPEGVECDDQLSGWIQRAVKLVGKLPAK